MDAGDGQVCRGHDFLWEPPPVQFFDFHLDSRTATRFEQMQGFRKEFVLAAVLVPPCVSKKYLQLRNSEAHHHLLEDKQKAKISVINIAPSLYKVFCRISEARQNLAPRNLQHNLGGRREARVTRHTHKKIQFHIFRHHLGYG